MFQSQCESESCYPRAAATLPPLHTLPRSTLSPAPPSPPLRALPGSALSPAPRSPPLPGLRLSAAPRALRESAAGWLSGSDGRPEPQGRGRGRELDTRSAWL